MGGAEGKDVDKAAEVVVLVVEELMMAGCAGVVGAGATEWLGRLVVPLDACG